MSKKIYEIQGWVSFLAIAILLILLFSPKANDVREEKFDLPYTLYLNKESPYSDFLDYLQRQMEIDLQYLRHLTKRKSAQKNVHFNSTRRIHVEGSEISFSYTESSLDEFDLKYGRSTGAARNHEFWNAEKEKIKKEPFLTKTITHEFTVLNDVHNYRKIKMDFFIVYCKKTSFFYEGRSYDYSSENIALLTALIKERKARDNGLIVYIDHDAILFDFGRILKSFEEAKISDFTVSGL